MTAAVLRRPPAWVGDYIGLPWRPGGRDRDGLDCWGLFRLVQAEVFGRHLPLYAEVDWRAMSREAVAALMEEERPRQAPWRQIGHYDPYARRWRQDEPERPGDGLLCRMAGAAMHVAVVVCHATALHIDEGAGACLIRIDGPDWEHRRDSLWRWDG